MTTAVGTSINKLFRVVIREPSKIEIGKKIDYFVLRPSIYYPNYKFVLITTGGAVTK